MGCFYTGFDYKNRKNGYFKIGETEKESPAQRLQKIRSTDSFQCLGYIRLIDETKSERLYVVHFKTNKDTPEQMFSFVPQAPHQYQALFKSMYDIWNAKKEGYYYSAMAVFYSILEAMQRDMLEERASQNLEKLDFVMKYIEKNFASENCSVSQMAQLFGSSETYFRRVFKDVYKMTPLKYINNLKVQYALELLRSGYFTVQKVAEKAGFEDVKYFSKFIKKQTGKSPSEFIT